MKNKTFLLLKVMLQNSSRINILKHSTDASRVKRTRSSLVGLAVIYIMIIFYSGLLSIGYGKFGLETALPVTMALTVSLTAFFTSIFKVNGYMFASGDYDMLMAMPFEVKSVVSARFLYMYVKSMPILLCISTSMLVGYAIYAKPAWYIYIFWIVGELFLPIIPMLGATLLGTVIAKIGSGFKYQKVAQTILTFIFVIPLFFSGTIIENLFKDDKVEQSLNDATKMLESTGKWYFPAGWFHKAILEGNVLCFAGLLVVSALLFEIMFFIISRNYRGINSALMNHEKSKSVNKKGQRSSVKYGRSSIVKSIAFKEFKRMTGSNTYAVNGAMGEVLALIIAILLLFVKAEDMIKFIFKGAPLTVDMLVPAIPLMVYFLLGMVATTTFSPSLEGKNAWILKSLPIKPMDIWKGKMLFNLELSVPIGILCGISFYFTARASILEAVLGILAISSLCIFSTVFGMYCGLKHINTQWENEVEVIKQGSAVVIYMLPNMIATLILAVAAVFAQNVMPCFLINLIFIVLPLMLSALFYTGVKKNAEVL